MEKCRSITKESYTEPQILHHDQIKFETAISTARGHWVFQWNEQNNCWERVWKTY
ncbi:hypothetical protein [Fictibacillus barbaricus]|uniref:Uncharacterized protein n=1 Tax=Fictibacillus barbaricus TaxID=182136 RepID=A0ABU1U1J7_9BACL|nr:hypothetical protein [Fictibacillus barbaricus]MDR7073344.1 hypothetical protein [Fictibacillus barbaricus]